MFTGKLTLNVTGFLTSYVKFLITSGLVLVLRAVNKVVAVNQLNFTYQKILLFYYFKYLKKYSDYSFEN